MSIHPIAADPRYVRVKELVAEGRLDEALENEIADDTRKNEGK